MPSVEQRSGSASVWFGAVVAAALLSLTGCPQDATPTPKAVPNPGGGGVAGFVGTANKVKLKTGMMSVLQAAQGYEASQGETPADVQALVEADLLTAAQAKDLWDHDYVLDTSGPAVRVLSYGADGVPGGEGPNKDWSSDELD